MPRATCCHTNIDAPYRSRHSRDTQWHRPSTHTLQIPTMWCPFAIVCVCWPPPPCHCCSTPCTDTACSRADADSCRFAYWNAVHHRWRGPWNADSDDCTTHSARCMWNTGPETDLLSSRLFRQQISDSIASLPWTPLQVDVANALLCYRSPDWVHRVSFGNLLAYSHPFGCQHSAEN